MADDERPAPSKAPTLESRQNRDPYYGEEPGRADRERERTDQDSRAFYLIEREAIQLRRRRWEAFADTTETSAREIPPIEDSLAQYQRPEKTGEQATGLTRLRLWVSRVFRTRRGGVR